MRLQADRLRRGSMRATRQPSLWLWTWVLPESSAA